MKFLNKTLLLGGIYVMFVYFRLDFSLALAIGVAMIVFSLPNRNDKLFDLLDNSP